MTKVTLGRTGITANKNGFGALPVQRVGFDQARTILRKAYGNGIDFFDTARSYSDSEEKIGYSLSDVRGRITIATKTPSTTAEGFWKDLETSLRLMKTDYVDILQFHNPAFCPKPGDGTGLYDTIQFPFCYLSGEQELEIVRLCKERNLGFIAMKALSGGLITDSAAAYAYLNQFDSVLPIWGVQREEELDEFLSYQENEPVLTQERKDKIAKDRKELSGNFCRGCGYCMPCPAGIEINNAARMSLMLRRAPSAAWLTEEWQEKMKKIENCIHCGHCVRHCPYGLNTPELLRRNYEDYKTFLK